MSENEIPPTPPTPPIAPKAPMPTIAPSVAAPTIKFVTTNSPVGAPTIQLKTANTPLSSSGAPTVPLKPANTPLPSSGAPTIQLKKPASTPLPLSGIPVTVALPKATVAITPPTKPIGPGNFGSTQKPTLFSEEEPEDETGAGTFAKILAGVGLVAALVLLGIQLNMTNIWVNVEDNNMRGDWSQLLE